MVGPGRGKAGPELRQVAGHTGPEMVSGAPPPTSEVLAVLSWIAAAEVNTPCVKQRRVHPPAAGTYIPHTAAFPVTCSALICVAVMSLLLIIHFRLTPDIGNLLTFIAYTMIPRPELILFQSSNPLRF